MPALYLGGGGPSRSLGLPNSLETLPWACVLTFKRLHEYENIMCEALHLGGGGPSRSLGLPNSMETRPALGFCLAASASARSSALLCVLVLAATLAACRSDLGQGRALWALASERQRTWLCCRQCDRNNLLQAVSKELAKLPVIGMQTACMQRLT